jgi:hypothetical protein
VSIRHAEFMARYFREQGVPAIAVHSGPGAPDRQEAIAALRAGQVRILFTVDLFNEGVDIPEVDLVLFLRPTESPTVFLQQLGRGLRLHPGKDRLEVLDLIGNHRGVHRKFPLLLGRNDVEAPVRELSPVLEALRSRELVLPRGISLDLDLQVIDLLTQLARKGEPLRDAMLEAHRELAAELGHAPSLMETHRWGRFPVRLLRREFGTWNRYLEAAGALAPVQAALEAEAGLFLAEVEKTQMTKSYKMVLLEAFVRRGGLSAPVALEVLVEDFRRFFLESPRHRKDLEGADLGDLERVSAEKLRDHVLRNPVAAWLNPGKGGRSVYFERSGDDLLYVGPRPRDVVAFEEAVLERVAWRLAAYFETRYERVDTFKVMHSGEKGIIMLGDNSRGVVPRDQGWKPVQVGGREMWAKFAKVAINVLKEFPTDEAPNRMTEVLEDLFGPGGFRSDRRNRVRIVPGEGETWCISPVGPGADGGRVS